MSLIRNTAKNVADPEGAKLFAGSGTEINVLDPDSNPDPKPDSNPDLKYIYK
jgi:hypothetical protein